MSTVCSTWSWLRIEVEESSVTLLTRNWKTFWYWRKVKLCQPRLASSILRLASSTRESTPSTASARSKRSMAIVMSRSVAGHVGSMPSATRSSSSLSTSFSTLNDRPSASNLGSL